MPFTLSHPAIVLPLKWIHRRWFSITGLIIGSMSPDIAYFMQMDAKANIGHSSMGIFIFDLPVSILAAIVFHQWVRNVLVSHFPAPWDARYAPVKQFHFLKYLRKRWYIFLVSALIGALSHLFWDSLAYPYGPVNYFWPQVFSQTITFFDSTVSVPTVIEYSGSLIGLMVMVIVFVKYVPGNGSISFQRLPVPNKLRFWGSVLLLTIIITCIQLLVRSSAPYLAQVIIVSISSACSSVLFVSTLFHLIMKPRK